MRKALGIQEVRLDRITELGELEDWHAGVDLWMGEWR
jgi:hypothetical protein